MSKWFSIVFKSSVSTLVVWRWKLTSTRSTGYSADSEMAFRYGGWLRIWNNQTWSQVALQRGIAPGSFPTRATVKTMGAGCWMVKTSVDKKINLLVLLPHVKQMNKINCQWLIEFHIKLLSKDYKPSQRSLLFRAIERFIRQPDSEYSLYGWNRHVDSLRLINLRVRRSDLLRHIPTNYSTQLHMWWPCRTVFMV